MSLHLPTACLQVFQLPSQLLDDTNYLLLNATWPKPSFLAGMAAHAPPKPFDSPFYFMVSYRMAFMPYDMPQAGFVNGTNVYAFAAANQNEAVNSVHLGEALWHGAWQE